MTDLLARLSVAEAGSRELDCRVEKAVGLAVALDGAGRATDAVGTRYRVPRYTTSLDAALALAERQGLDGWNTLYAAMMNWKAHDPRGPLSQTLPLALCLAILKATTPPVKTGEG